MRCHIPCKTRFRLLVRLYREGFDPSELQMMVSIMFLISPINRLSLAQPTLRRAFFRLVIGISRVGASGTFSAGDGL